SARIELLPDTCVHLRGIGSAERPSYCAMPPGSAVVGDAFEELEPLLKVHEPLCRFDLRLGEGEAAASIRQLRRFFHGWAPLPGAPARSELPDARRATGVNTCILRRSTS